jgi:hypothetical protein
MPKPTGRAMVLDLSKPMRSRAMPITGNASHQLRSRGARGYADGDSSDGDCDEAANAHPGRPSPGEAAALVAAAVGARPAADQVESVVGEPGPRLGDRRDDEDEGMRRIGEAPRR